MKTYDTKEKQKNIRWSISLKKVDEVRENSKAEGKIRTLHLSPRQAQ
jgi:hypothetical protein